MPSDDRRARERAAQRDLITTTARRVATDEGWGAVTTRRLATEIEYSQPVIYKHFRSLEDLAEAVALEGFAELGSALAAAGDDPAALAEAYLDWAASEPELYDVMFTRATRLAFGADEPPAPLAAAFAALRSAVATVAGSRDVDTLAEVTWAGLHGLVVLERDGRLRPGHRAERLALIVAQLTQHPGALT